MTEVIPSAEFKNLIEASKEKPVLIDVYAEWCGPCRALTPVINRMSHALAEDVRIVKIDYDEADRNGGENNPVVKFMNEHGIRGIPSLLLFDKGEYKGEFDSGPRTHENIQAWMEKTLGQKFSPPPLAPAMASYAIVLGPSPAEKEAKLRLAQEFLAASQGALVPVAERGELSPNLGVAELEGQQLGLIVTTTQQGAQDIADALPDREVLDAAGTRVIPHNPAPP